MPGAIESIKEETSDEFEQVQGSVFVFYHSSIQLTRRTVTLSRANQATIMNGLKYVATALSRSTARHGRALRRAELRH